MSDLSAKDHMPPVAAPIKPHSPPDGSMIGMPNLLRSISGKKQLAIASAKPDASKAVTVPNASVPRIGWFAVYRNRFPSRALNPIVDAILRVYYFTSLRLLVGLFEWPLG